MSGYIPKRVISNRKNGLDGTGFKKSGSGSIIGMHPMLRRFISTRSPAIKIENINNTTTYNITSNLTSVAEGGTIIITLTTTLVPDGTVLNWKIVGASANDFLNSVTSGSVTITNNTGFFNIITVQNDDDSTIYEPFYVEINDNNNNLLATSNILNIIKNYYLATTFPESYYGNPAINANGDIIAFGTFYFTGIGRVYIYTNTAGVWNTSSPVVLYGNNNSFFGCSVSINAIGDAVIVGAINENKAYIFTKNNGIWNTNPVATLSGQNNSGFGVSVFMNETGDAVIVGAFNENKAYIYKKVNGTWNNTPSDTFTGDANSAFGINVCINATADIALVSIAATNALTSGKVYVYTKISGVWNSTILTNGIPRGNFGENYININSTGDTICILDYDLYLCYIYTKTNNLWNETFSIIKSNSICMNRSGNILIVNEFIGDTIVGRSYSLNLYVKTNGVWNTNPMYSIFNNKPETSIYDFNNLAINLTGEYIVCFNNQPITQLYSTKSNFNYLSFG
jgi:hypothetical protein